MQQHDRHVWEWRINSDKIWAKHGYRWGRLEPNYPVPATIGYEITRYGKYLVDTRERFDGMPLFRGYRWYQTFNFWRGWDWR